MFEAIVEKVPIERVLVGDFVYASGELTRLMDSRCVLGKRAMSNERTRRVVGWLVEVAGGPVEWWPRGSTLWRRRTDPR